MPSYGVYFTEDEAPAVKNAARLSKEQRVAPYIAEAVRQRMQREGHQANDPRAELLAAAEEVGMTRALSAVVAAKRNRRK